MLRKNSRLVLVALSLLLSSWSSYTVQACRCQVPSNVTDAFQKSIVGGERSTVVKVRVHDPIVDPAAVVSTDPNSGPPLESNFRATILRTYRAGFGACHLHRRRGRTTEVVVTTDQVGAGCGFLFVPHTTYLFFGSMFEKVVPGSGKSPQKVLSVSSCSYSAVFGQLSGADRRVLARRPYQNTCRLSKCDCGPLPPDSPPAVTCPDGSTAGFTGTCSDQGSPVCEFEPLKFCP